MQARPSVPTAVVIEDPEHIVLHDGFLISATTLLLAAIATALLHSSLPILDYPAGAAQHAAVHSEGGAAAGGGEHAQWDAALHVAQEEGLPSELAARVVGHAGDIEAAAGQPAGWPKGRCCRQMVPHGV